MREHGPPFCNLLQAVQQDELARIVGEVDACCARPAVAGAVASALIRLREEGDEYDQRLAAAMIAKYVRRWLRHRETNEVRGG